MAAGVPNFYGERLTQVREARGLTALSLSELLGVSAATVSQYEHNNQKPLLPMLEKLARCLNVPGSFFLRPVTFASSDRLLFRCMASATKGARSRARRRYEWLRELVEYVAEDFEFPALRLPPSLAIPEDFRRIRRACIDDAAVECQRLWGVTKGFIGHLVRLLERNGVVVARGDLHADTLDAFSDFTDTNQAFIFLGADKAACVRSRFDAAHELGHLILHRHLDRKHLASKADFQLIERQAHYFARVLLLPEESFSNELWSPTLDSFLALKGKTKVSIGVMIKRCEDLGIVNDEEAKRLWINRTRRGWNRSEPLDDTLPVEQPVLLRQCFERLLYEGGRDPSSLVEELRLPTADVEELANLPVGTLTREENKVIPMPKLRSGTNESPPGDQEGVARVIPFRFN